MLTRDKMAFLQPAHILQVFLCCEVFELCHKCPQFMRLITVKFEVDWEIDIGVLCRE